MEFITKVMVFFATCGIAALFPGFWRSWKPVHRVNHYHYIITVDKTEE